MSSLGKLPKRSDVTYALSPLADKYFALGTYLELEEKQLKAIESDHRGDQSRCLIETISLWQRNNTTGECSWSTLADAVKKVGGHDNLVRELRERARDMAAKDLMEAGSKPKMLHHPSTERASDSGYLSAVQHDSNQTRPQRRDSSEDESGYSSKSELGDSSGSEAECFELAPGCGCTGKKPCSLYTFCTGGCPNPTRKRVPILRKKSKGSAVTSQSEIPFEDEHDFEDYEERTKEIQKSFGIFVCKTSHLFKGSNVTIRELNLYLQGAYPVMKPRMEELSKATHFEDFFRIIVDQACSWFDYGIIKDLILCFCTGARSCLDEYEARFKSYAEQRRLPKGMKHIEVGGGGRRGGRQLVIKIDREWEDVTFSDLDKLRGTFASILGPDIRRSDLYLADIREGCIMMTFMITKELAERLFPSRSCLSSSQQVKLLKKEGVISLRCGKLTWRATSRSSEAGSDVKEKMVPLTSHSWRFKIVDIRFLMAAMVLLASVLAGFSGVSYVGSASGPLSNRFGYASPADPESISPAYLLVEVTWRRNITNSSGGYNPELILVFAHPDTSWSNNSEYRVKLRCKTSSRPLIVSCIWNGTLFRGYSNRLIKNATGVGIDDAPGLNHGPDLHSWLTHQTSILHRSSNRQFTHWCCAAIHTLVNDHSIAYVDARGLPICRCAGHFSGQPKVRSVSANGSDQPKKKSKHSTSSKRWSCLLQRVSDKTLSLFKDTRSFIELNATLISHSNGVLQIIHVLC